MRIIQQGKTPHPKLPWYAGLKLKCSECECIFLLEAKDKIGGKHDGYYVSCPHCKQSLKILGKESSSVDSAESIFSAVFGKDTFKTLFGK